MEILKALNFDIWNFSFMAINILVVIAFLYKFLYTPVGQILAQREEKIADSLKKAEEDKKEAEALLEKYREQITTAQSEAGEIINQATKKSDEILANTINQAQAEAHSIVAKAEAQAEAIKVKATVQVKEDMAGLVVAAAGKVIQKELSAKEHEALVQDFLEEHLLSKFKEYIKAAGAEKEIIEVELKTVVNLAPEKLRDIEQALTETLGKKVTLQHTIDTGLTGGVQIRFEDILLDDSLASRLLQLKEALIS